MSAQSMTSWTCNFQFLRKYEINFFLLLLYCTLSCVIFIFLFFCSPLRLRIFTLFVQYFVRSAAPQTALWGDPMPDRDSNTGPACLEAGTLTTRPPHLLKTTTPLRILSGNLSKTFCAKSKWSNLNRNISKIILIC